MKKIAILGSTGKVGSQALEVIRSYPKEFQVIGLACGHQSDKFRKQIKNYEINLFCFFPKFLKRKTIIHLDNKYFSFSVSWWR